MKKILAVVLLSVCSIQAWSGFTTAKIEKILMYESGNLIYIYPAGGVQNAPACHGSNGDYISFSMSRPMAKEYLSGLLMAFASGKTVGFRTIDNQCIDQSVSATLSYFTING